MPRRADVPSFDGAMLLQASCYLVRFSSGTGAQGRIFSTFSNTFIKDIFFLLNIYRIYKNWFKVAYIDILLDLFIKINIYQIIFLVLEF